MFNGTVKFVAEIRGNGITFSSFDFNPNEPGIVKVQIEGPDGHEIKSAVHLVSVATEDVGMVLAEKVNTATLNRIAFLYNLAIEKARSTESSFSTVNPPPGVHLVAAGAAMFIRGAGTVALGITPPALPAFKSQLEQVALPGERNFGLLRSARQSESPAEEFMHLYHILLMIHDDKQPKVDGFIEGQEPSVPQTQHPRKPIGVMETIYTRLRNEFAHNRAGGNLEPTKAEMANRLGGLIALVKRAIELHP